MKALTVVIINPLLGSGSKFAMSIYISRAVDPRAQAQA